VLTAAQQAEELDDVLWPDGIGVREDGHGFGFPPSYA
jgi:hypothetical protein